MLDHIEIDLMPLSVKMQMKSIRKISIYTVGCVFLFLVAMLLLGVFHDILTAMAFSLILLLVTVPLFLPIFRYEKISQSRVCFMSEYIYILDKKGECWRSIDYNSINNVQIRDISDFFYGENRVLFQNRYICVFLNGLTEIPAVPFAKLFTEKDFILFSYRQDALQWIQQKCRY